MNVVTYPSEVQQDYSFVTEVVCCDGIFLIIICCEQGMGEPLNNYSAVVDAIRAMTAAPFQLSPRKITVSTVLTFYSLNSSPLILFWIVFLFINFVSSSKLLIIIDSD